MQVHVQCTLKVQCTSFIFDITRIIKLKGDYKQIFSMIKLSKKKMFVWRPKIPVFCS